jgi:protein-arginine kinase activator protein McsA
MNCQLCSKKKKLAITNVWFKNELREALLCTSCGATIIKEKENE